VRELRRRPAHPARGAALARGDRDDRGAAGQGRRLVRGHAVGAALSALLSLRGASPEDLAEFRVDFEGENAAWAARCADAADISALQAIVAEAGDVAEDTAGRSLLARIDVRWHEALARATKNRLRIGIALGIHDAVLRRHEALVRPAAADEHLGTIPADIAGITAAIVAGDAETARLRMREHIEAWNRRTIG
jgi:GntR family transcriptional repressor for pyruvate dehydrogenase complex